MDDCVAALADPGFAWIVDDFSTPEEAFDTARALIAARCAIDEVAPLTVIGDFVIPPLDGRETREFQTLHFDFGLPLDPKVDQDVARYTALHVPSTARSVSAVTRMVPLAALLSQRDWPARVELIRRLIAYGRTHGAWDDAGGYAEGSLARVVEAAAGDSPILPSVKVNPRFLCGMEFDSLRAEIEFFARHGLQVADVQIKISLQPGGLLVFDNLALAHGRRGIRRPGELRQRVFGHKGLAATAQRRLRDLVLCAFQPSQPDRPGALVTVSTP